MKRSTRLLLGGWLALTFVIVPITAQTPFRVMSYNVENLFDIRDNPETEDNDFLPEGNRYWSHKRYAHKLRQIARVILAAGEWETPALVGLCEVENDTVLTDLLERTPLRSMNYRYCITDGSDRRGINVALLYQPDRFRKISQQSIPVRFSEKPRKTTRDLLHVSGELLSGDTLDLFVCHFPSRYGGEKESERERFDAAITLRDAADSIAALRHCPLLLAMGDFNDTPADPSLARHLTGGCLRNLFASLEPSPVKGTHKYRGRWALLDQMFSNLSPNDSRASLRLISDSPRIFAPPFLLTDDRTWSDKRPFRTYHGSRYEGGYSDHLPILVDFTLWAPPSSAASSAERRHDACSSSSCVRSERSAAR